MIRKVSYYLITLQFLRPNGLLFLKILLSKIYSVKLENWVVSSKEKVQSRSGQESDFKSKVAAPSQTEPVNCLVGCGQGLVSWTGYLHFSWLHVGLLHWGLPGWSSHFSLFEKEPTIIIDFTRLCCFQDSACRHLRGSGFLGGEKPRKQLRASQEAGPADAQALLCTQPLLPGFFLSHGNYPQGPNCFSPVLASNKSTSLGYQLLL